MNDELKIKHILQRLTLRVRYEIIRNISMQFLEEAIMISTELKQQVEKAYDFRGHVTLNLKNNEKFEGFVFNREYDNPLSKENFYLEFYPKGSDVSKRIALTDLKSIEITGEDCAAGKEWKPVEKK